MTNHDLSHLKNDPAFSLSENERALMRARLLEMTRVPRRVSSPFMFLFHMRVTVFALILIVSTTSVSFAAEGALPGETLYTLKVQVNEPVALFIAPGAEAKAKVAVHQAEERIREVEMLAARGELEEDQIIESVEDAEKHIDTANDQVQLLADAGDVSTARGIEADLDATLSAHTELLDAQADDSDENAARHLRFVSDAVARANIERHTSYENTDEEALAYAHESYARAKDRISELEQGIENDGVPEETAAELSAEHDRLSGEFASNESLGEQDSSVEVYSALEKRAVRALTFLKAARDIARETDKEVVIAFGASTDASAATPASAKEAPALMMVTTLSLEATSTEEASTSVEEVGEEIAPEEPKLRFWLRDRVLGD